MRLVRRRRQKREGREGKDGATVTAFIWILSPGERNVYCPSSIRVTPPSDTWWPADKTPDACNSLPSDQARARGRCGTESRGLGGKFTMSVFKSGRGEGGQGRVARAKERRKKGMRS